MAGLEVGGDAEEPRSPSHSACRHQGTRTLHQGPKDDPNSLSKKSREKLYSGCSRIGPGLVNPQISCLPTFLACCLPDVTYSPQEVELLSPVLQTKRLRPKKGKELHKVPSGATLPRGFRCLIGEGDCLIQ